MDQDQDYDFQEARQILAKGLKEKIEKFEKNLLELRQLETAKLAELNKAFPPGKAKQVEAIKEKLEDEGVGKEKAANIAFGSAWNQANKTEHAPMTLCKECKENPCKCTLKTDVLPEKTKEIPAPGSGGPVVKIPGRKMKKAEPKSGMPAIMGGTASATSATKSPTAAKPLYTPHDQEKRADTLSSFTPASKFSAQGFTGPSNISSGLQLQTEGQKANAPAAKAPESSRLTGLARIRAVSRQPINKKENFGNEQIAIIDEEGRQYKGIREASRKLNIEASHITENLEGKRDQVSGHKFRHAK